MESGPEFRIVGGASDESVDKVLTDIDDAFSKNEGPIIERLRKFVTDNGIEKNTEMLAIIQYANEYTNTLLLQHSIEPYDIPAQNIHALKPVDFAKIENAFSAFAHPLSHMIVISANNRLSKTQAALTLIHEMLHLKGYKAIQIEDTEKKDPELTNYRTGVAMESSQSADSFHEHFIGLNEAIVSTLETRALASTLHYPGYEKDKASFDDPDTQKYLSLLKTKGMRIDDISNAKKDGEKWIISRTGYPRHREVLDFIAEKIFEDNTDIYENTEDVYRLFFDAHFSGKLLTIARLVEHSFGEGSFRILGNMGTDSESARTHLDTFKKLHRKN